MKSLYLIRGVSGSGKTTFAETLDVSRVISADDYFVNDAGDYNFNPAKLKDAHAYCQRITEHAMRVLGVDLAVANTFTQEWEMKPYFDLAEKYGYRVFSIIVENRHGGESVHDVPIETLIKQRNRFEVEL
jgi:predicted kinase